MNSKALFTLCRIALASTRTLYREELLFTQHKNGDFDTIFVTEQSYAAPILNLDRHISDSFLPHFFAV